MKFQSIGDCRMPSDLSKLAYSREEWRFVYRPELLWQNVLTGDLSHNPGRIDHNQLSGLQQLMLSGILITNKLLIIALRCVIYQDTLFQEFLVEFFQVVPVFFYPKRIFYTCKMSFRDKETWKCFQRMNFIRCEKNVLYYFILSASLQPSTE